MNEVRKDHSIGAGTGAAAGAVTGATVGAVGGPLGMAVGAVVGGVLGAAAGDSIAEAVNPTEYDTYWRNNYQKSSAYVSGREWDDYSPAYKFGYDTYPNYRGRAFNEVEGDLERNWNAAKGRSRLAWNEAKSAVRDGWHHIERALPGDADGDGR